MDGKVKRSHGNRRTEQRRARAAHGTGREPWPADCLVALGLVGVLLVLLPVAAS